MIFQITPRLTSRVTANPPRSEHPPAPVQPMRMDHRGAHVRVPRQLLNGSDVDSVFEVVGCNVAPGASASARSACSTVLLSIREGQRSLPVRFGRPLLGHFATHLLGPVGWVLRLFRLVFGEHRFVLASRTRAVMPHCSGNSVNTAVISEIEAAIVTLPNRFWTLFLAHSPLLPVERLIRWFSG